MGTKSSSFEPPSDGIWLNGSSVEIAGKCFAWKRDDQTRSVVWVSAASTSRFGNRSKLSPQVLSRSLAIEAVWMATDSGEADLAPALYRALQQGRIWDCNTVVAHVESIQDPLARLLGLAELSAAPEARADKLYTASAQMLDVAIHRASLRAGQAAWLELRKDLPGEALDTVMHWVHASFYQSAWARSIFEQTMTRQQYVQSLSNMHHYVRQTTQHLGRAVAYAHDRDLRRHLIDHLNGEINHEVSIENDLRQMGEDVEYVMLHRVPSPATKAFMATQEANIAFYQDPMLFMASPLVAEGITAHMPKEFVPCLRGLLASWGVAKPEKATTFLTSHIHTDGGDDGHWEATANMLGDYLIDEPTQRRFLCAMRAAAESIQRSFDANIHDLPLFSGNFEKKARSA
jgi:hypothetical protein